MHDETYAMLGRERRADLDREADRRAWASRLPRRPRVAVIRLLSAFGHMFKTLVGPLVALAVAASVPGTAAALPAGASATSSPVDPHALAQAQQIRADVDARYPSLRVTEASSTAVIDSLTLFTAEADPRVVPAENGIYFAVCPIRATCPYPGRAARAPSAFAPRRLALELAVRTFLETEANLVVVSLPTPRFVLLVFERAELDARAISEELANDPRRQASLQLRRVVDSATLPRLFGPFGLEPCPNGLDTLLAVSLGLGRAPEISGAQGMSSHD